MLNVLSHTKYKKEHENIVVGFFFHFYSCNLRISNLLKYRIVRKPKGLNLNNRQHLKKNKIEISKNSRFRDPIAIIYISGTSI